MSSGMGGKKFFGLDMPHFDGVEYHPVWIVKCKALPTDRFPDCMQHIRCSTEEEAVALQAERGGEIEYSDGAVRLERIYHSPKDER